MWGLQAVSLELRNNSIFVLQIVEIIGEDECRRPDNSPPSYEDAMKYVNEAFESSQGEVSIATWYNHPL